MKAQRPLLTGRISYAAVLSCLRSGGLWLAALGILSLHLAPIALANTSITQGYNVKEPLPIGSIVSIEKNTTDTVFAASTSNIANLLGVVINPESSLITLSNGQRSQVQVATSGTVPVLISDMNGKIARGDHITASPIPGVGMKATASVMVLGIVQGDAGNGTVQSYKDKQGKEHKVTLGQVPVLLNVAYYFKEPEKTIIPSAIQNVANALAGKAVSSTPILISAAIFLVTIIVVVSIIYSMIRSSIISVGRNPMSQSAIYRNLLHMSTLVLLILGGGFAAIYLVLTRL
ncbi:hypothetical protein JNJ66_06390 [Candidatus Saccharibacteria bacterium]|nr:hypothetical protein [Candidatus Saccharibacteria bacterium]